MLGVTTLPQLSERQMHWIRWGLTVGWCGMIASLFWEAPPALPGLLLSIDPNQCVLVQGQCLPQQPTAIALSVFWTLVIPGSILVILFLGHETWRRLCPLSFVSQLPRALGLQRKRKVANRNGATRYELVKIRKDSWLGKYHLFVQFGLLLLGLTVRLLVANASAIALGILLLATIGSAIAIGFLYEGKSWCQYFCPMAPVQLVFTGPRGLLGNEAHQGQRQTITQSMCRSIDKDGNEKSACVGCQSPCIDIDAERNYWETATKPGRKFVQYGYLGLLLGFFLYYPLYAGNFDYLFSGAWLREANIVSTLAQPGFFLAGQALPIPKWLAVPLMLILSTGIGYGALLMLEKVYRRYLKQYDKTISSQQVIHIIFSICTFFAFNIFFFFSSRSLLSNAPIPVHLLFNAIIVLISTLWLSRTLNRSSELYARESLANSLRRQLGKLAVDFSRFLEGRSMDDLKAEEIYVLAKVLPGFNQELSLQVYKGVLRETLEQGNADSASSLEVLRPIRQELNIKDEDHFTVLTELSSVEPDLLDPKKRRTRESQLRVESYRQALASMLLDLVDSGMSLQEAMQRQRKQIQFLKLEYGMTTEEEEEVLSQILAGEKSTILRKAETLQEQMRHLADRYHVLSHHGLDAQTPVFKLLRSTAVHHKQQIITKQMLGLLEMLGDSPEAVELANTTQALVGNVLPEILQTPDGTLTWKSRLKPAVYARLEAIDRKAIAPDSAPPPPEAYSPEADLALTTRSLIDVLDELVYDLDPLIQTLALYGLNLLDAQAAQTQATQFLAAKQQSHWLIRETAQNLLDRAHTQSAQEVQTLIAQVVNAGQPEKRLFQQPVIRVGTDASNDIVLSAPTIAKHHALFYLDGDGFSVVDLGSSPTGLYVGKQHLLGDRLPLQPGTLIRFSKNPDPAMTVHWEKHPILTPKLPTETMGTLDKVLLLFESRFFHSLKPDALIELGRDALVKVYPKGDRMCTAGDPSDSILLLIDGIADVVIKRGNNEQVVGTVNVGETIGEMGVLTRQKRSASVIAAFDYCRVLVIQADKFDGVLRQDPEVSRNLLVVLSSRLQSMTSQVKANANSGRS